MIAKAIFTHSQIFVKRQDVRTGAFVKEYSLDFAAQSRSGFHPIIGSKLLDYLFFWVRKKKFIRVVKAHCFGALLSWNSFILIDFWECSATKAVVRIAARYLVGYRIVRKVNYLDWFICIYKKATASLLWLYMSEIGSWGNLLDTLSRNVNGLVDYRFFTAQWSTGSLKKEALFFIIHLSLGGIINYASITKPTFHSAWVHI